MELWIVHKAVDCYTTHEGHANAVCLKRSQDPLDIATFSAAVSGWFYRSLMFRVKSRRDRNVRTGNGTPQAPSQDNLDILFPGRECIVISGAYSRAGALYLAREALKKIATPPTPPAVEPDVERVATSQAAPTPERKPLTKKEIAELNRQWRQYMRAHVDG